ncbi:MAG: glycosyltransferase family 4 protein [Planctomycetaceae bacterium]|nr:glycosyltransferase family 4 protein [Planctomycetaceae bacterium]
MAMGKITVGNFPYCLDSNPYQRLFSGALESAGLKVIRIPPRKMFPLHYATSFPLDVLHLDWPHDFYHGRTWLLTRIKRVMYWLGLRRLRRCKVVWTVHNLVGHDSPDVVQEIRLLQRLVDRCNALMVMSNSALQQVQATYRLDRGQRIAVVPHGHYIDAYPNTITAADARRRLGLEHSRRVVLSLGRMCRYKGLDDLVRAFGAQAKAGDTLVLAGQPENLQLVQELETLARQNIPAGASLCLRPQEVADEDLQLYFNAADVVALPFRRILNSGSLLLAMSFARCVVGPKAGSLPEVACPQAFFGYDGDDEGGLSAALSHAMEQDDLLQRGQQARQYVRGRYDWSDIGVKLRTLYQELLDR